MLQILQFAEMATSSDQPIDWYYAQHELLEKQGIDLKLEMEKKFVLYLLSTICLQHSPTSIYYC